jgi:hypothetical protein
VRNPLARRVNVADEALSRVLALAGSAAGVLPAASFTINVNKGGNDTTGNGTDEKPYLTIGKAMTVAAGLSPSAALPALILVGPGTYTENVAWAPFVWVTAAESGGTGGTIIAGNVTLSAGWIASGASPTGGLDAVFVTGSCTLDFTGAASFGFFLMESVSVTGNVTATGDSVQGGGLSATTMEVGGNTTVTGAFLFTVTSVMAGLGVPGNTITIASSAAQVAAWTSSNDSIVSNVTINASAGQDVTVAMQGTGWGPSGNVPTNPTGTLTLTDGGDGHTSYTASAGGIPNVVTLVGGAAPPVGVSPLVGLNSKKPDGTNAALGTLPRADGAGGIAWS